MIGGSGMTGPFIARDLLRMGHEVHLLHRTRSASPLLAGAVQWPGDKAGLPAQRAWLAGLAPQVVVHMVAFNAKDAADLVAAAAGIAERSVVISSIDVYRAFGRFHRTESGPLEAVPCPEGAPLRANLGSDHEKILVERVAASDPRLPCTILRYPGVYGPGDGQHRFRAWVRRMDEGRPVLIGSAQARWRFALGYVENVAAAAALAIVDPRARAETFNIQEDDPPARGDLVARIAERIGWRGPLLRLPHERLPRHLAGDGDFSQDIVADASKIRRMLGHVEAIPQDICLERTIAWERAHPQSAAEIADEYAAEDLALASGSAGDGG